MAEVSDDQVLTSKNHKLLNVANNAEVLFWIGIISIPIICFATVSQLKNQFDLYGAIHTSSSNFWQNLLQDPISGLQFIGQLLNVFVKVIPIVLILKGISLGLRMIVETDVNYRLNGEDK